MATDEQPPAAEHKRYALWTTVVCATAAAAGHAVLWLAFAQGWSTGDRITVPWQPVAGISLTVVAVVAFGGFYLATERARIAIAASFLITFLVFITYVLTIEGLRGAIDGPAKDLVDDMRYVVSLIVAFYFGSETAVNALSVWAGRQASPTDKQASPTEKGDVK